MSLLRKDHCVCVFVCVCVCECVCVCVCVCGCVCVSQEVTSSLFSGSALLLHAGAHIHSTSIEQTRPQKPLALTRAFPSLQSHCTFLHLQDGARVCVLLALAASCLNALCLTLFCPAILHSTSLIASHAICFPPFALLLFVCRDDDHATKSIDYGKRPLAPPSYSTSLIVFLFVAIAGFHVALARLIYQEYCR